MMIEHDAQCGSKQQEGVLVKITRYTHQVVL